MSCTSPARSGVTSEIAPRRRWEIRERRERIGFSTLLRGLADWV
jgi:hypothetical protein